MNKTKKKILFVDNEKEQLNSMRMLLHSKRKEWETHFIANGTEALKLLDEKTFDLVVTDIRLPDISGNIILAEIRKKQPGAIRFVLSGYSDTNEIIKSVKNAHQFLSKPCSAEKLIGSITRSLHLKDVLLNENAARAIAAISSLPTLPDLYQKIEQELNSEDASVNKIGELISNDMGMSASILKIVNSSFFGIYSKISSPSKAVTLLGLNTIKGLILGEHLFNSIENNNRVFPIKSLAEHCKFTGFMAREIINFENGGREMAEQAFLSGFLHDLGKLILISSFSKEYEEVIKNVKNLKISSSKAEADILGFTHAEVGAYLLALWGFDVPVVEAVYGHHSPSILKSFDLSPCVAVHIANSFEHELHARDDEDLLNLLDTQWLEQGGYSVKLPQLLECCAIKLGNHIKE